MIDIFSKVLEKFHLYKADAILLINNAVLLNISTINFGMLQSQVKNIVEICGVVTSFLATIAFAWYKMGKMRSDAVARDLANEKEREAVERADLENKERELNLKHKELDLEDRRTKAESDKLELESKQIDLESKQIDLDIRKVEKEEIPAILDEIRKDIKQNKNINNVSNNIRN